ncbi:MAG: hypothetical protein JWP48_1337 [Actinoallomurus sp.]|nr:hypothetical protein [Actinoallomurus sp.]
MGKTLWHTTMSLDDFIAVRLARRRLTHTTQVTNLWFRVTK